MLVTRRRLPVIQHHYVVSHLIGDAVDKRRAGDRVQQRPIGDPRERALLAGWTMDRLYTGGPRHGIDNLRRAVPGSRAKVSAPRSGPAERGPQAGLVARRSRTALFAAVRGLEAVNVTTRPTFAFGSAIPVPKKFNPGAPSVRALYDITPTGGFVGVIPVGDSGAIYSASQVQVVLNWLEELKRLVPAK